MSQLLIINTNVVTMDLAQPRARCIGISDGRIDFVSTENSPQMTDSQTIVIDCSGKTVVPGLIDAHCHLSAYGKRLTSLDLSQRRAACLSDVQALIQAAAAHQPSGTWITGYGYDEFRLAEKRHLTRWELDVAAPSHPVRLIHRSGHAQLLNSMGLAQLGITIESEDPPNGMIDREIPSGEPSGLLFGMDAQIAQQLSTSKNPGEPDTGIELAGRALSTQGITTIYDATQRNHLGRMAQIRLWKQQNLFPQRIHMALGWEDFHNLIYIPEEYSTLAYGVKLVLDEITGVMHPSQSVLNDRVLQLHLAGIPAVIHAIEQRHIAAACTAIEYAQRQAPSIRPRHRIEHCSICPPTLAGRLATAGITVVTQPAFLYQDGDRYLKTVPKDELPYLYPIASLLKAGVCTAGSSDCPISPPNPLLGIYAATTRRSQSGRTVLAGEGISPYHALRLFTCNAAYALGLEGDLGSIQVGKAADLAVLSGDPTALPIEEILEIRVEATMIHGQFVWTAQSSNYS